MLTHSVATFHVTYRQVNAFKGGTRTTWSMAELTTIGDNGRNVKDYCKHHYKCDTDR
jgi:hypothetical protein